MSKKFTLCLNMIVKDESHVIITTLNNLCEKFVFDYWVICDTGSTDNTIELIKDFFKVKNIKGELHEDKWVDFGYNRSLALSNAYNKTDYLLIFDADDIFVGDIILPTNIFEYDSYLLNFGNDSIYNRKQIINNRKKWKYVGVLHEYIECLEKDICYVINGNYYIISGKNGSRSNDPQKYKKDALLLEKAYQQTLKNNDTIYERYSYYCANSYKDANDVENAIKWYKNTLLLNNWNQEKYMSCLNLYYMYEKQSIENAIFYLIKSYEYDKTRVEGIYNLIKYYCIQNQNDTAFHFYTFIQNYFENEYMNDTFNSKLFVDKNTYSFYLPYYMLIVCENVKRYDEGLKILNILFTMDNCSADEWWIKNLIHNLQFFIYKNKELVFINKWHSYIKKINNKNFDINRDLINSYDIYNISNFLQYYSPNINNVVYTDESYVVIAILAMNKEYSLPFYLQCISNQTYDKKYIHLYIRTNDNDDSTQDILLEFINKYSEEYASIFYNDTDISTELKQNKDQWNPLRFQIMGQIKQESIDHAKKLNAHYFVVDCDKFIIPCTLENMMKNKNMGIISPMLKVGFTDTIKTDQYKDIYKSQVFYSNFHYDVESNGYYKSNNKYYSILNYEITALIRVCCVHSVYLIPNQYLSLVSYNDNSNRMEYVIFSESMRKYSIPQYIDNSEKYGYITFLEDKELFEIENNFWKTTLFN